MKEEKTSTVCSAAFIQVSQFFEDDRFNVNQAYVEVMRRVESLKYPNVYKLCNLDRLTKLVMEDQRRRPNMQGVREAITILQTEMEGYYSDLSRLDIGKKGKHDFKILGPDFQAIDKNGNKVAVEVKNLAYNKESKPTETAFENGKQMSAKAYRQQHYWTQTNEDTLRKRFGSNIKIENLPEEPTDFVLVFDLFGVDQDAKKEVIAGIKEGAKNSD